MTTPVIVMDSLAPEDVTWLVRRLPAEVRGALERPGAPAAYVAGGFVRAVIAGEEINDVDIFTNSRESAETLAQLIVVQTYTPFVHSVVTDNAITIQGTTPVTQIIYRWTFTNLAECLESFDFTIAKAGITYQNGKWIGLCDPAFYRDLAAKRLRYTFPDRREDEAGSMLRLLKFYAKGYRAPLLSIAGVVARAVKGMDADGDEVRFAGAVQRRLRVVDPAADPQPSCPVSNRR